MVVDHKARLVYTSDQLASMLGYPQSALAKMPLALLLPQPYSQMHDAWFKVRQVSQLHDIALHACQHHVAAALVRQTHQCWSNDVFLLLCRISNKDGTILRNMCLPACCLTGDAQQGPWRIKLQVWRSCAPAVSDRRAAACDAENDNPGQHRLGAAVACRTGAGEQPVLG